MPDITLSADIHSFMQAADAAAGRAALNAATLGANTFTALQTITQASANAGILASTGYSLTGSDATNMVDLAGTWNTTGAPTAIKLNITNTASNAASLLMDLQASTVPKFSVRVDGLVTISSSGATKLRFTDTASSRSFYIQQQSYTSKFVNETSGGIMHFVDGSTGVYLKLENAYQAVFTQTGISFTNSYSALGTEDVFLTRKAAATLQLGQDAAGVTNQSLTAASRITSDGVGANLTISAGNGRGGAGGSLIFSTYTTAAAATIGTLTTRLTLDTAGLLTFADAVDMAFNTTTGTKIGTATGQKIGFWNATPVVQQVLATGGGATVDNVIALLQTLGLCKQS